MGHSCMSSSRVGSVWYVPRLHRYISTCECCVQGYHGAAAGKGKQLAKTELEKLKLSEMTTREAVFAAAKM